MGDLDKHWAQSPTSATVGQLTDISKNYSQKETAKFQSQTESMFQRVCLSDGQQVEARSLPTAPEESRKAESFRTS